MGLVSVMSALVHAFEAPTNTPSIEAYKVYTVEHAAESVMVVSASKEVPGFVESHTSIAAFYRFRGVVDRKTRGHLVVHSVGKRAISDDDGNDQVLSRRGSRQASKSLAEALSSGVCIF